MFRRAAYLAQMLHNERLPPNTLLAAQAKRLSALVRHAGSQVPFYRDLYAAQDIRLASFQGLKDLPSLPIVGKRLLRAAGAAPLPLDAPGPGAGRAGLRDGSHRHLRHF